MSGPMGDDATTAGLDFSARQRRKYVCRNPVQRFLLRRFFRRLRAWIDALAPKSVLDFGCGEGFFWQRLAEWGPLPPVVGLDLRPDALALARRLLPQMTFTQGDLLDFHPDHQTFDLVIASEVLEHLDVPERYVRKLCELCSGWMILTVPHEPYFRICNLLRGRDLRFLGNHPDHVQHWSKRGFHRFVSPFLMIEKLETSFPFILALGKPRKS